MVSLQQKGAATDQGRTLTLKDLDGIGVIPFEEQDLDLLIFPGVEDEHGGYPRSDEGTNLVNLKIRTDVDTEVGLRRQGHRDEFGSERVHSSHDAVLQAGSAQGNDLGPLGVLRAGQDDTLPVQ